MIGGIGGFGVESGGRLKLISKIFSLDEFPKSPGQDTHNFPSPTAAPNSCNLNTAKPQTPNPQVSKPTQHLTKNIIIN